MDPVVSVAVLTYHPSWQKLKPTLCSILRQQNIDMEIILADDGSENNLQEEAGAYFREYRFEHFRLLPNPENRGTVKNLISALEKARGKYVYVISPGDFIYAETTLQKMTAFAETNNADICFGEAVAYYLNEQGEPVLPEDRPLQPSRPDMYHDLNIFRQKAAFFFLDYILGATYLRKTEVFLKYLRKIEHFVKYAEDTPTTMYAMADGIPVHYYPEPVVFYECGSGISSRKENNWQEILAAEYRTAYTNLIHDYPKDRVLRCAWRYRYDKREAEPVWKQAIVDPGVVRAFYRRRRFPVRMNASTEENQEKLKALLKSE